MRRAAADRLALSLVAEPGDPRLVDLLADHEPGAVVDAARSARPLGGSALPAAWLDRGRGLDADLESALARGSAHGLRWVCPGDAEWPAQVDDLAHVPALHGAAGPPLGLWVRGGGRLDRLCERSVAVVGARSCTAYGAECASDVAAEVSDHGITVVSGAAYGIDAAGHRGALAMGRGTAAVLACGADADYPRAHAALLTRIAEDGVVVSEQRPGQVPIKARFLSRNRLIAGLASGTVVVEAAQRSGSLNTLHWADALGRPTMAVPGPVTSQMSAGCHEAVRAGKAVLVAGGPDVVGELGGLDDPAPERVGGPATEYDALPAAARRVLDALAWSSAQPPEAVAATAGVDLAATGAALGLLARRGLAAAVEGRWVLTRRADLAAAPSASTVGE